MSDGVNRLDGAGRKRKAISRLEMALVAIFILTIPLVNPWVRGDGVGYYAYARAILIEHRLDFTKDWQHGNESFVMGRVGPDGKVNSEEFTRTGHIANNWSIGPSLLWLPFLGAAHVTVGILDSLGARIPLDGFSRPYRLAMALSTALYGFLGLYISFRLAQEYFEERWAFLATVGIWFASSLPVYMYFNPSWSHAHSAFVDALFLWYWHRTRGARTWRQWILLGLISGLMVDVYYPNGVLLLIPLLEAGVRYLAIIRGGGGGARNALLLFSRHATYFAFFVVALLPTFVSRSIIYGSPFSTGYPTVDAWAWKSPAFLNVLVSADHGVLTWTPIVLLALFGLLLFLKVDRLFASYLLAATFAFYVVVALHPDWDGLSSFGNRFFISLTPVFILGLAGFFQWLSHSWHDDAAWRTAGIVVALLIAWNLGLVFQWGTHLIPARGPISFRDAAYNQVAVVPEVAFQELKSYFTRRKEMMNQIEQQDVNHLKTAPTGGSE